ncbi:MAG: sigma-70 family RNA polymerase sigma factor [Bacteroidales bacterium]|nr:sigma-70 family RNA polymerase sigma factor [Bacteroidales bacterium]
MKPDEATLVEACLRHDQKACRQLYDSYAPLMFGICMRYARSRQAAEDILHEGFIKVFENLGKLRDTSQLASWIRSLMVHTAVSAYRREHNVEALSDLTDESVSSDADEIYGNIDIEVIMRAVQQLPTAYRMAFNLCDVEEYSFAEASEKLGIRESTVRSNLCRARRILAEKLADYTE